LAPTALRPAKWQGHNGSTPHGSAAIGDYAPRRPPPWRAAAEFDAIYCSHNLEHYYRHDGRKVLAGFLHLLKPDGFIDIRVPDVGELMQIVVKNNLDIDDFLYESPMGPITVRDVFYGHGGEIERSGADFYAHKTGFTRKALMRFIQEAGFPVVFIAGGSLEIIALAFKGPPSPYAATLFNLPPVA
jgi:SAM-dependent methyltransferase